MPTNTHHRPFGRVAYLRGKPAADWIAALSTRRPVAEPARRTDGRN